MWLPVAHLTSLSVLSAQQANTWTFDVAKCHKDCELMVSLHWNCIFCISVCFSAAIIVLVLLIVMMLKQ